MAQVKLSDQQVQACERAAAYLVEAFPWDDTEEGYGYWGSVRTKLFAKIQYRTSDGRPCVEPIRIPADEDAKERPMVMVRDHEGEIWRPKKLIMVDDHCHGDFVTIADNHCISRWKQCRFPAEAELKEMQQ